MVLMAATVAAAAVMERVLAVVLAAFLLEGSLVGRGWESAGR